MVHIRVYARIYTYMRACTLPMHSVFLGPNGSVKAAAGPVVRKRTYFMAVDELVSPVNMLAFLMH